MSILFQRCAPLRRHLTKAAQMGNVRLKEAYPALYKLAIPLNTTATISGEVSPYRTLVWKCPNGPDHEWSMRVVDMIKRFDRYHNSCT